MSAGLALAAILALAQEQVGPLAGGGYLLNSGWRLRPAGRQVTLDTLPMATALAPDGKHLLVLNGGYNPPSISVLDAAAGREIGRAAVADGWLGLALAPKGDRVYVGGGSQAAVFEFSFAGGKLAAERTFAVAGASFIGDVALSPGGRLIYAADLYNDSIAVINPQSGMVIERLKTGRRPYRILFHPDGQSFFVSSWADGAVLHHEAETGKLLGRLRLGPHPTDMVWGSGLAAEEDKPAIPRRLFVAAANTNNVYSIGVTESKELRLVEVINVSMTPRQPAGMTPSGLALSADLKRLYVVCSDANAVAVADVSEAQSRVLGFIPAGWYPTAARVLRSGTLVVLNGRSPGRIKTGTAQFVAPFTEAELDAYTRTVFENSPYRDEKLLDAGTPKDSPVPARPGDPSPIEHVVYIIEGSSSKVMPNHHKLAREWVLLDNFYVNAEAGADGRQWSTAAIASDYVQKLWPNSFRRGRLNDHQGEEPAATPPAGYIWTNAAAAGVSMRNYGHFVANRPQAAAGGTQVLVVRDSTLAPVTNLYFRGADANYPDVERAKVFLKDLAEFEKTGQMPRLILMRLGNEHTMEAPAAADNDQALGLIVEALTRSQFWPATAIFVAEGGAQNGPDHVDWRRSPAFVISPYARRRTVDSTMYNTTAMLRTMELILGLRPMTHFDAGARPMASVFQPGADRRPYTAVQPH
ncbi:MAG: bifunctional YncE family protein/alkaline phosphatase family protein [Acidobacteriota bacterium]